MARTCVDKRQGRAGKDSDGIHVPTAIFTGIQTSNMVRWIGGSRNRVAEIRANGAEKRQNLTNLDDFGIKAA